jgi:preprotein translocase subunit YajC
MTKITPLFDVATVLAQAPAPGQAGNPMMQLLPIGLMMLGFWFLVIAPQRKKQKELQKAIDALQTGDEVLTNGGIYGEITNKKDDRFVIRIADNTKVEVAKGFIQTVVKKSGDEKSK